MSGKTRGSPWSKGAVVANNAFAKSRGPGVPVVESTDARKSHDLACARWFDRARARRVARKRHMSPIVVVISRVLAEQTQQMPLPQYDDVIEQLAT
jgi:hypothetical protein